MKAVSVLVALLPGGLFAQAAPLIDYHQHLFSPAAAALVTGNQKSPGISARDLVALLDSAGIQRALVLSVAYTWASANRPTLPDEYEKVKAENDWTAQQVAQYPNRLRAFCSVNPLKAWAVEELERCAHDPQLHYGLKLHFGNSDVDLSNPEQVAQVRRIFAAANQHHMPIVVHMRTSINKRRPYGAEQARVLLHELLPAAPDVPVQIAHLAGAGDYRDTTVDAALGVFIDAIVKHDKRMKHVWFDVTTVALPNTSPELRQLIATRIRQIGVKRVLYGSDAATGGNATPRVLWAAFRALPLSEKEFRTIARNVTPYMKR